MSSKYLLISFSLMAAAMNAHAKLEAHEWGTFTSLVGSNGITQNGMYHEDEALPGFVHGFGDIINAPPPIDDPVVIRPPFPRQPDPVQPPPRRPPCRSKACFEQEVFQRNVVTQKMETPVIYFYTDTAQKVDVNVKFPEGVVTETFPGPVSTSPSSRSNVVLANGNTTFSVNLTTQKGDSRIPYVDLQNIYSHARNVNSNVVVGGNGEAEKFIFYRGLGRFQPKLQITSVNGGVNFDDSEENAEIRAFLVHVNATGEARMMRIPNRFRQLVGVSADQIALLSDHNQAAGDIILTGQDAHSALTHSLTVAGLNADEAEAMISTWEHGYLHVPGLRLLYILPRAEVDAVLPLTITPKPDALVRVFVGRIEVMLDTQEQQILKDVLAKKDDFDVNSLGRFAEPMLRRVMDVYSNGKPTAEGTALFARLIARSAQGSEATASIH